MADVAVHTPWKAIGETVGRMVARRLPSPADVDDVVQEVLLRVWKNGGSLREQDRFGAWLARIAYTAAADHLRARQRHPLVAASGPDAEADLDGTEPEASGEARALVEAALRPFIAQLPARYREAITMSELDGVPHAEIARRLGLSLSAIKSRVQRGRAQLRRDLERCCEIALDARGGPITCQRRSPALRVPGCCEGGGAPGGGGGAP
jgi:RNA polymerase sigma-70 factor (ECF subfamily)